MNEHQKMVRDFHLAFSRPAPEDFTIPPTADLERRASFCLEESLEMYDAIGVKMECMKAVVGRYPEKVDVPEFIDAICDLLYVAYGSAVELGIDIEPYFAEVHRANMAKLWPDGVHSTPGGKVIKPPDWKPPDAASILLGKLKLDRAWVKHGPMGLGGAGPCDPHCRKCSIEAKIKILGGSW